MKSKQLVGWVGLLSDVCIYKMFYDCSLLFRPSDMMALTTDHERNMTNTILIQSRPMCNFIKKNLFGFIFIVDNRYHFFYTNFITHVHNVIVT